jgi:hypothetical protein
MSKICILILGLLIVAFYGGGCSKLNCNSAAHSLGRLLACWCLIVVPLIQPLQAQEYTLHTFEKLQLTDKFWTEAPAIADLNRDGHNDIIAGPYWYQGPDFKKRQEYYPATLTTKVKRTDGHEEVIECRPRSLSRGRTCWRRRQFVLVLATRK